MKSEEEDKISTVIGKNTFYFRNQKFEEEYEGNILSLKETLLIVKNKVETEGLKKEIFECLLKEKGLEALLALTGFSNESFKRLITIIRLIDDTELNKLVYKEKWSKDSTENKTISEWEDKFIFKK